MQEASKLIEKDRVDIVTGVTGSNELMAVVKPITGAGTFLVGTSGGPSPLAGKECNQNYFNVAFQNNQWSEGMGSYMSHIGVKRLYLIGMDYQGGWDLIAGARSTYKGEVVAQVFTPMAQLDFSAEIAQIRAAKPDAVFAGYGGGLAVAFVKQYAQAGLIKSIPLYSIDAFSDPLLFQAQGDAALGVMVSGHYSTELDKPINKRFVADFRAKYGRDPSTFAEQQYDAVMLIDSAVRAVKGNLTDKQALRAAFRKADFESLRGPFKFNNNHMPIQNIYVQRVDKRENGAMYLKLVWTAVEGAKDSFYKSCPMNW